MKAFRIHEFGTPSDAVLDEVDTPKPVPGQVVVRIEAASVNPLDLQMLAGHMRPVFPVQLPYTVGTDFSGVIDAVGPGVSRFEPGDCVVGRSEPSAGGAFAQAVIVEAAALSPIPSSMSFEQAAALPTAAGTAWLALFGVGQLKAGQRVLVHAGAGGVGSYAVQFAKQAGAHVIATASSKNHDLVKEIGADEAIDYHREDFSKRLNDIDLVVDTVGGETTERSWPVLKAGGMLVSLVDHAIQGRGDVQAAFVFFRHDASALEEIIARFEAGRLQVVLDTIHPLEDTRAALEQVAGRHARGKVIVRPAGAMIRGLS